MTRLKWREFAMKPADPGEYEVVKHGKTFLWIQVSDKPWAGPVEKLATLESGLMVVVDPAPGPAEPAAKPGPAASPGPVAGVKPAPVVIEPICAVMPAVEPFKVKTPGLSESADSKLFRLMAMGKRAREAEMGRGEPGAAVVVVDEPVPGSGHAESSGPYFGMTRQEWKWMGSDKQPKWLTRHGLTFGEGDEEKYGEWLEGMPR